MHAATSPARSFLNQETKHIAHGQTNKQTNQRERERRDRDETETRQREKERGRQTDRGRQRGEVVVSATTRNKTGKQSTQKPVGCMCVVYFLHVCCVMCVYAPLCLCLSVSLSLSLSLSLSVSLSFCLPHTLARSLCNPCFGCA